MGDAAALYERSDLIRLEGKVKHALSSFVGVELPEGWAPASFHLAVGEVSAGETIGVAGLEDATISGDKRRGLRVLAVRVGSPPRYLEVAAAPSGGGESDPSSSTPKKDDMDWSDV